MIKTAIFGGSFNPIHTGHAMIANYVVQTGLVDELWLVPGRLNPLKAENPPLDNAHRLSMCRLVAELCDRVGVSAFEMNRPAPSYTIDTLRGLSEQHPDREFSLLIGSDNWLCFDKWKDHEKIVEDFKVLVYPRPGFDVDEKGMPENVTLLKDVPQAVISSSDIREWVKEGKNMNFFLPQDVWNYIKSRGLYE